MDTECSAAFRRHPAAASRLWKASAPPRLLRPHGEAACPRTFQHLVRVVNGVQSQNPVAEPGLHQQHRQTVDLLAADDAADQILGVRLARRVSAERSESPLPRATLTGSRTPTIRLTECGPNRPARRCFVRAPGVLIPRWQPRWVPWEKSTLLCETLDSR